MIKKIDEKNNKILADIDIAQANLYVFKNSSEKDKWQDLLIKARHQVIDNPEYSEKLVNRVDEVISNLWKRIFKWQDLQGKLILSFAILILLEIITLITLIKYNLIADEIISVIIFGLIGGTLSVALNLGKDLDIHNSNKLSIAKIILRPLIGIVSAILLFYIQKINLIKLLPEVNQQYSLSIISFIAGYSERIIIKTVTNYISINSTGE